jgi:hypothetical protein
MDKPRANTATAHKLARMVYFMLTRGEAYVDQGQQHYEEQQRRPQAPPRRARLCSHAHIHPRMHTPQPVLFLMSLSIHTADTCAARLAVPAQCR